MPPKGLMAKRNVGTNIPSSTAGAIIGQTNPLFGLSADFPKLVEIDLDRLETNPDQPRTVFGEDALRSLADSIEKHGLKQPVLVQELPGTDRYRLVAGERRLRAHRLLGRPTIFAIITEGSPDEIALIENVQRVDLNVFEFARGLKRLIEAHGYTQTEAGAIVGCAVAEVNRRLSVLNLAQRIQADYTASPDTVSRSVLYEIAVVEDEAEQLRLWDLAKRGGTVAEVRAARPKRASSGSEPLRILGRGILTIDQQLRTIAQLEDAIQKEHRDRLREIRDRIDALLDEKRPARIPTS